LPALPTLTALFQNTGNRAEISSCIRRAKKASRLNAYKAKVFKNMPFSLKNRLRANNDGLQAVFPKEAALK
jgi:hypothetical protein